MIDAQERFRRREPVKPKAGSPDQVVERDPEALVVVDDWGQRYGAHSGLSSARIGRRFNRLLVGENYDRGMMPSLSAAASIVSWW